MTKSIVIPSLWLLLAINILSGCADKKNSTAKEPGMFPNDWFYRQRAYPYSELRSDLYYKALQVARSMEVAGLKSSQDSWNLVGPLNIGGRITDIEMPQDDQNTIYLAAASGGIFKSIDLGTHWTSVFDDALVLSIGDMDISVSNPDIIYVGTGEPNAGGGSHTYEGYGVFASSDAGTSWKQAGLNQAGSIGRVKIDPADPQIVYVAAMGHLFSYNSERGVFRTRNGGSNWEKVLFLSDSTGASDLCMNPKNSQIIYAAMWERTRRPNYQSYGGKTSGIWRTTDGGDTWKELLNGLPKGNVGRIGIDISDSNPSVLYATYTDSTGYLNGVFKTTDGGDNWAKTTDLGENASYWWWFSEIDVDPINPNIAYVSGLLAYKTVNGGNTWSNTFSSAHVDMHGVFVHPKNNGLALLCSDGGLYVSRFGGTSSFHIENLPITQFYTCEVDYQNPGRVYGGTQDNGTIRMTGGLINRWQSIYGGDGFVVKVDPQDNDFLYAQYQYGGLGRSVNGNDPNPSFSGAKQGINESDRMNWKSPLELDPQNPNILYFGSHRLYKSTNRAQSWKAVSSDLTKGKGVNVNYGTLTTISVSPLNSNIIYVGTDDGNVWNTLDGTITWNLVSTNLPDRWITCVQASPLDPDEAFVTISGYRWDSYLPHIYKTTDNGATWQDVSGNLPDFPVNSIRIDPVIHNTWYAGTDGGVFITRNGGDTWEIYGAGLPKVPVLDLNLHNPSRMLTAATFGRSMYKIPLPSAESKPEPMVHPLKMSTFPNPFREELTISVTVEASVHGDLSVYDLNGKLITKIHHGQLDPGDHRFTWNGKSDIGQHTASGLYILRLVTKELNTTLKINKL